MVAAQKAKREYESYKHKNSTYNYMMKSGVVPNGGVTQEPEATFADMKPMQEQIKELVAVTKAANVITNGGNPLGPEPMQ